jgi:hypothetical protein
MEKVQVHIGKIPCSVAAAELVDVLERAAGKGTVNKVDIETNPQTCESRGYGFNVSFNTVEAAEKSAMLGMNGHLVLLNIQLQVNLTDRDIVKRSRHSETTWEDVLFQATFLMLISLHNIQARRKGSWDASFVGRIYHLTWCLSLEVNLA